MLYITGGGDTKAIITGPYIIGMYIQRSSSHKGIWFHCNNISSGMCSPSIIRELSVDCKLYSPFQYWGTAKVWYPMSCFILHMSISDFTAAQGITAIRDVWYPLLVGLSMISGNQYCPEIIAS